MGFFDWLFRRKREQLDEPRLPTGPAHQFSTGMAANAPQPDVTQIMPSPVQPPGVQMELMRTQLENMRMQYESINARLQNIERIVTEIRGFCR
ncbi:MAG: hypothetical protein ABIA12_01320 [Candidatus Aenigmatarchaeota archaeon]